MFPDKEQLKRYFLGRFESGLLEEIIQFGTYRELDEGQTLMRPGSYVRSIPIILEGTLKILRADDNGREALLYYLGGLDSCAMSLTCCLDRQMSEVTAIAEEKTTLIAVPVEKTEEWLCRYPSWRQFVFDVYRRRFEDMLHTIDSVVFARLDERLVEYLHKKARTAGSSILTITHEEIANELATSREVISRLLKQLERTGSVKLSRGKIELADSRF